MIFNLTLCLLLLLLHSVISEFFIPPDSEITEVCQPDDFVLNCPRDMSIVIDKESVRVGRGGAWEANTRCPSSTLNSSTIHSCGDVNLGPDLAEKCDGLQKCKLWWNKNKGISTANLTKLICPDETVPASLYLTVQYTCQFSTHFKTFLQRKRDEVVEMWEKGDAREADARVEKYLDSTLASFSFQSGGQFGRSGSEQSVATSQAAVKDALIALESLGTTIADLLDRQESNVAKQFESQATAMSVQVSNETMTWKREGMEISLPIQSDADSRQKVVFLVLKNSSTLLGSQADLVSVVLNGGVTNTTRLSKNLEFTLAHEDVKDYANLTCAFWSDDNSSWSKEGCQPTGRNSSHVTCSCNHLTSFSLVWNIWSQNQTEELTETQSLLLDWTTKAGMILSLICLTLSILVFIWIDPGDRADRDFIHLHLCLSLFFLQIIFISGIDMTSSRSGCVIIAILLHFLHLSVFSWSLLEGVEVFNMIYRVFRTGYSRRWRVLLAGYLPPFILVSTSLTVDLALHLLDPPYHPLSYGTPYCCWLSLDNGFYLWFVIPASIAVFVNLGFLLYASCAFRSILSRSSTAFQPETQTPVLPLLRGVCSMVFLLGSSFSIGILYMIVRSFPLGVLYNILTTMQGVGILVFQVMLNPSAKSQLNRRFHRLKVHCSGFYSFSSRFSPSTKSKVAESGVELSSFNKSNNNNY